MHRLSVFIFFMLLLAGCSSSKVLKTEKSEGADFSSYKTFDFYKVEARGDTNSQKFNENIEKLEDAIAIKLQKFGYLLSKTNPDLLINIGVVVRKKFKHARQISAQMLPVISDKEGIPGNQRMWKLAATARGQ